MNTIWKFAINHNDKTVIELPQGSKFLSAQMQHGLPCLWFQVDPEAIKEERAIIIYGTGHEIFAPDHKQYLGTVQEMGGALVWHIYMTTDPLNF